MLKEGKIYILKDEGLRLEIIQLHYDTQIAKPSSLVIYIKLFAYKTT